MLGGVPADTSPELLKTLHEMGHGDTLVIGDANFPVVSIAAERNHINIRCDGHRAIDTPGVISQLMLLDSFVEKPVTIMDKMEIHHNLECPIWDEFTDIVTKHDEHDTNAVGFLDRLMFYDTAKDAYMVVPTSETVFYAYIMIQRGCLWRQSGRVLHA